MSFITNLVAALIWGVGYIVPAGGEIIKDIGLFALSGGITNWLAIHMLFEKVPLCYGSGVIPNRFEEFKIAIRTLIIQQFFTREHIERFFQQQGNGLLPSPQAITEKINFDAVFDGLVDAITSSSFGSLLGMIGGKSALETLRPTITARLKDIVRDLAVQTLDGEKEEDMTSLLIRKVEQMIDARLAELTPQKVKEIVQEMIQKHLGWLVVWGGVFGGLIGLVAALLR